MELIINKYFNTVPKKVAYLSEGFYGKVFLAEMEKPPCQVIVKNYYFPNIAERECLQLNTLAKYSTVKIPKIYHIHKSDNDFQNDILFMEYIQGINAGSNDIEVSENNRKNICETIINNLISYHKTINPEGFGELDSKHLTADWQSYYKPKAEKIFNKAQKQYEKGKLDEKVFKVMEKAINNFDKIFYIPIKTARLIHGDYNTWNIMLDEQKTCIAAVIDPYNCSWADSELDLYHLKNANGDYYGLFDNYKSKFTLSENYKIKHCFYDLFSEVMHYHDANIDTRPAMQLFVNKANDLEQEMRKAFIN